MTTNTVLPAIPAPGPGALFVKGIANGGAAASAAQYLSFGHAFQIGQMPKGSGLAANFGAGATPCQLDVKTAYADGSAAHAVITVQAPSVAAGATTWGQFSATGAPSGAALNLASALGQTTLSLTLSASALPDWQAGQSVTGGAIVKPTKGNAGGYCFQFNTQPANTGTTGGTAPAWPQTPQNQVPLGGTDPSLVTDNTVTWTNISTGLPTLAATDLIALVKNAAFDPWLDGPLAVQGRAIAVLTQGLRVVIDLTAFADGTISADVMLANDIAMLPAAGALCYTATLTMNGKVAYSSPALVHYQYTNWTAEVGTVPGDVRVIHNPSDFVEAQAVPPYTTTLGVDPSNQTLAQECVSGAQFGLPLVNTPIGTNNDLVATYMPGVGGRWDIGPNDSWSVWGFITQDATLQAVAFEIAKVNESIPWHLWNAETGDFYNFVDLPSLWPEAGNNNGYGITGLTQAGQLGNGWSIDPAHFPELVYLQYLQSGRRHHLDELVATSQAVVLWQWPGTRNNATNGGATNDGVIWSAQLRGAAWTLRNQVYAYYASPDGSTRKARAKQVLDDNFAWLNSQTAAWTSYEGQMAGYVPVGLCSTYGGDSMMPPWQQDYFFSTVMMTAAMGHAGALQFAEWMAGFIVGRFATDIPGWYPQDGIVYNMYAFVGGASYNATPKPPPITTWAAEETLLQSNSISQVTVSTGAAVTDWQGNSITEPPGTLVDTWNHQAGDYGQLALNSLAGAQIIGITGASDAYGWLEAANSPFTTPAWWAMGPLVQMLPRTQNASQVLASAAPVAPPQATITGIALSQTSIAASSPTGTVVGAISVAETGGTFSGTLALGGTDAASFAISSSNLVTAAALAGKSYSLTITATEAGASGSPFSQPFSITASAPVITGVTLSSSTFAGGVAAGTVVGVVSVAETGGTFSGALTLGGTNAGDFALSGKTLVTVGTLYDGSYSITITATEQGATGSPFTASFAITGTLSIAELQTELSAAQAQIATLTSQASGLTAEVSTLTSQLSTAQGTVNSDQAQIASLQSQLATAEGQASAAQSQVTSLQAEIAQVESIAAASAMGKIITLAAGKS